MIKDIRGAVFAKILLADDAPIYDRRCLFGNSPNVRQNYLLLKQVMVCRSQVNGVSLGKILSQFTTDNTPQDGSTNTAIDVFLKVSTLHVVHLATRLKQQRL